MMLNKETLVNTSDNTTTVSKIAVLNPYLQGGHTETAEMESTARFVQVANKQSIDVKMVSSSDEINDYDPDFVFSLTYQCAKLSKYPTYVSVNIPVSMVENVPRFVRNILTYDAFLTASSSVENWLKHLCDAHGKSSHIAPGYFSVPATNFEPCDYANTIAMYMGTNWDGTRHKDLFTTLSDGTYLKCYGPPKSWSHYPATLYGGPVPFDGVTSLKRYHQHASGLCIGHPIFDNEGIAHNRFYEISAASALPICSNNNELVRETYGDSVLYINNHAPTEILTQEIIEKVQWIRSNPKIAEEMARAAHSIFNEKLSMEYYLKRMLELHHQVCVTNGFQPSPSQTSILNSHSPTITDAKPKVVYLIRSRFIDEHIIPVLSSIANQRHENMEIVLLSEFGAESLIRSYQRLNLPPLKIHTITYKGKESNHELIALLDKLNAEWISILGEQDSLFANHTTVAMNTLKQHKNRSNIYAIVTGCLDVSNMKRLNEVAMDEHHIQNLNFTGLNTNTTETIKHLCSILFKFDSSLSVFGNVDEIDLYDLDIDNLSTLFSEKEKLLRTYEISCSSKSESSVIASYIHDANLFKKQIADLQNTINNQIALINDIYASRSWRYAGILRKAASFSRQIARKIGLLEKQTIA